MEILTKKFWKDVKKIFEEAQREDSPAPQAGESAKAELKDPRESPEQKAGQNDGDRQSQDPGEQHVADRPPL